MAKAIIGRGIRFSVVGALCTLVAYASFWTLAHVIHYQLANVISWLLTCSLGFLLHRFVTHKIQGPERIGRQFALHMAGSVGQLAIGAIGFAILIGWWGLNYTLAFILNLAFTASYMFAYMESMTFGHGGKTDDLRR